MKATKIFLTLICSLLAFESFAQSDVQASVFWNNKYTKWRYENCQGEWKKGYQCDDKKK